MEEPVLVTGASGRLGRMLVAQLTAAGYRVRALSRRKRTAPENANLTWAVGDLRRGAGLGGAVAGVDVVVHCATAGRGDTAAAGNLLGALGTAGRTHAHLIFISIVGVDRIPLGYYREKLAVEELIVASGQPHTILRATQFHELILRLFTTQRALPWLVVPRGFRFRPIDSAAVADRLSHIVDGEPLGRTADIGGPHVESVTDLARQYLRATGSHRAVTPIGIPGRIGHAFRAGANLGPEHAGLGRTFSAFLEDQARIRGQP